MYHTQNNSFSMLFSMSSNNGHRAFDEGEMYSSYTTSSPSSSVDCTLSLGTPSTRLTNDHNLNHDHHHDKNKRSSSCMSNFGWNILSTSKHSPTAPAPAKNLRGGSNARGDPLLARRCANCDTTSTPLWRNGPRGPKSLCNACGIRFKKEERRATAASNGCAAIENWAVQPPKMPCYASNTYGNEFRFIEDQDNHRDSETGIPFLSWRFNVHTDRPSLVHDFTR